jgi:hypothetical protein
MEILAAKKTATGHPSMRYAYSKQVGSLEAN